MGFGVYSSKTAPLGSTKHLPPTKNKLNHQNHCCLLLTFSSATTTPVKSCNNMTVSQDTMTQSSISISKPFILGNYPINPYRINTYLSDIYETYAYYHPPQIHPSIFQKNTLFLTKKYLTGCSNTIHILLINESRLATLERFKKSTCEEAKVETLRWPGGRSTEMINGNHGVFLTNNKKMFQTKVTI